ncbi:hypothetical protein GGR51DRAFT_518859 [Nemania sp. FL0031]|nr:hypothetical protein GGR51DRAFT_518859 [Nemania sp. FL0031]
MTVLEIALPNLVKDGALVTEALETLVPPFVVNLQKGGVKNGLRGFFETQDGKDIRDQYREVLLLEWPSVQHFKDFIASPPFVQFADKLKEKYLAGPPELKMLSVDGEVSQLYGGEPILEYIAVKPNDASEESVKKLLQQLQSSIGDLGTSKVAFGGSVNLDVQEIAILSVYASEAEHEAAKTSASRQQLLATLKSAATVTSLVGHVKKEIPIVQ